MIALIIGMALGVILVGTSPVIPQHVLEGLVYLAGDQANALLGLVILMGLILLVFSWRFGTWRYLVLVMLSLAGLLIGFTNASHEATQYQSTKRALAQGGLWHVKVEHQSRDVKGEILAYQLRLLKRCSSPQNCDEFFAPLTRPLSVSLTRSQRDGDQMRGLRSGEEWLLFIKPLSFKPRVNPGFDVSWAQMLKGSLGKINVSPKGAKRLREAALWYQWRDGLGKKLRYASHIAQSRFSSLSIEPALIALSIGDRSAMNDAHWTLLRKTGTTHLWAISGLHLALICGGIFFIVRQLCARLNRLNTYVMPATVATFVAILFGAVYGWLVGWPIPAQRAYIMLCVVLLSAPILNRFSTFKTGILTGVLWAWVVLTWMNPFALFSASFWLSFGAIACITLYLSGRLGERSVSQYPGLRSRRYRSLLSLKLQFFLTLGLIPVSVFYFGGVSSVGFFANLIAIPVITLAIMPLALLNVALVSAFSISPHYLGEWVYWLLDILFVGLSLLADIDRPYITVEPSTPKLILGIIGVALLLAPLGALVRVSGMLLILSGLVPTSIEGLFADNQEPEPQAVFFSSEHPIIMLSGGDSTSNRYILDSTGGTSHQERWILRDSLGSNYNNTPTDTARSLWSVGSIHLKELKPDGSVRVYDLCGDDWLPETFPFTLNRRFSVPAATRLQRAKSLDGNAQCALDFTWHEQRWFMVGSLNSYQQRALALQLRQQKNQVQYNGFLLSGSTFFGGLLNGLVNERNASGSPKAFVWSAKPLSQETLTRFTARQMTVQELKSGTAMVYSKTLGWRAAITPRFTDSH